MAWICPVCGSDDNGSTSLRCSCGYAMQEQRIRKPRVKRPFGLYCLTFIFAWSSIAAFVGIFAFDQESIIHKLINFSYAITAMVTVFGLLKLKLWLHEAYISCCCSVVAMMLYMQFGVYSTNRKSITSFIVSAVFVGILLLAIYKYISKSLKCNRLLNHQAEQ